MSIITIDNIRVQSLTLENARNVKHGEIVIHKGPVVLDDASIVAIYGQNGSGKTTVVDAFSVLQHLMRGDAMPPEAEGIINLNAASAELQFRFIVEVHVAGEKTGVMQWEVCYDLTLARSAEQKVYVADERVRGKQVVPQIRQARFNDWLVSSEKATRYPVTPVRLWRELGIRALREKDELRAKQTIAMHEGRSFLFSSYFQRILQGCRGDNTEISILQSLHSYAMSSLFVVNKMHTGLIYINLVLPLSFRHEQHNDFGPHGSAGTHMLTLNEQDSLPREWFRDLERLLEELNIVFETLIPEFAIKAHVLSEQLSRQNEELIVFELVSVRDGTEIPLRFESNGVRRLVSILSLLVSVYNDPSVCVVIDELDAGVFEFLLGQLIDILAQAGQGQLIFTSHNMRALEVLRPRQIVVTTADPYARFTTLKNIKPTNNTRNKYYELIEKDEVYYTGRSRLNVERAFQWVGEAWDQREQSSC